MNCKIFLLKINPPSGKNRVAWQSDGARFFAFEGVLC